jgi:L-ribulokinase
MPETPDAVVIGVDFGTLSGRAVVVRVRDGAELGSAVHAYEPAVVERLLSRPVLGGRIGLLT